MLVGAGGVELGTAKEKMLKHRELLPGGGRPALFPETEPGTVVGCRQAERWHRMAAVLWQVPVRCETLVREI